MLIVEDCEDDAELLLRELRSAGFDPTWERVEDAESMSAVLDQSPWQVILSDHSMPRFDAPRALELIQARGIDIPFIIVSGSMGEEQAVAAMRAGASDYLLKGRLGRLGTAVEREIAQARVREEGRRAEERRRFMEKQMAHMASHDRLTGLPNRSSLETRIEAAMTGRSSDTPPLAVLHVSLDGFELINSTLGHEQGDLVLGEAARRLQAAAPRDGLVASLGGEQFGVLAYECNVARAMQLARQLLRAFDAPVPVGEIPVQLEASIGIALFPDHAEQVSTLLRCASVAMYQARQSGGEGLAVYSADGNPFDPSTLALLGQLRPAIEDGQLNAEFQPIVESLTREVVGAEALVRWSHPQWGQIPPGRFVPAAESCGLIHPLFRRVLQMSLAQWKAWNEEGVDLSVAVNLSARNLMDAATVEHILRLVHEECLPPGALELEITESAVMVDPDRAIRVLRNLREQGLELAIDDFGTGFSSFGYLRDLPIDKLKIDRTFVARMLESEKDAAIVRATIDLGHTLGLVVAAEGVEDETTFDVLAGLGCDVIQGYFVARSMPGAEFARWSAESGWSVRARTEARRSP